MGRKRIKESLKQEENLVNQKKVVLWGFHWWNKHCTMILKRHGKKWKQSNDGGLNVEQSSWLKNFIRMKVLKLLINGFLDLPIASKFHFLEKRFVRKKIRKVWVIHWQNSIQRCCVPEDVEYTKRKTSQTRIRHHNPLWWMIEKHMLTREPLRYGVLPMF